MDFPLPCPTQEKEKASQKRPSPPPFSQDKNLAPPNRFQRLHNNIFKKPLQWAFSTPFKKSQREAKDLKSPSISPDMNERSVSVEQDNSLAVLESLGKLKLSIDAVSQEQTLHQMLAAGQDALLIAFLCQRKKLGKERFQWIDAEDDKGMTPLMIASQQGSKALPLLLSEGACIDKQSKGGDTALLLAIEWQHFQQAFYLLERGADVNLQTKGGYSPLLFAVYHSHLKLSKALLDHGAEGNPVILATGETPLIIACARNHLGLVELLLNHPFTSQHIDLDAQSKIGISALMIAAGQGNCKLALLLLERGINPNLQDDNGNTALFYAIRREHSDVAKMLIQRGEVDIHLKNCAQETALIVAASLGLLPIVKELVKRSPASPWIPNKEGLSASVLASSSGHQNVRQFLAHLDSPCALPQQEECADRKFLAHLFHLKGRSKIHSIDYDAQAQSFFSQDIELDLEGFLSSAAIWWQRLVKGSELFQAKNPQQMEQKDLKELRQIASLLAKGNTLDFKTLLKRQRQHRPILMPSGFAGHIIYIVIFNRLFFICNRGELSEVDAGIYQFNSEKLSAPILEAIHQIKGDAAQYLRYMKEELPHQLQFEKTEPIDHLESQLQLPGQTVGNCSWASIESAIYILFFLQTARKYPEQNLEQTIAQALKLFNQWLFFQQAFHLKEYFKSHPLSGAFGERSGDPTLAAMASRKLIQAKRLFDMEPSTLELVDQVERCFQEMKNSMRTSQPPTEHQRL
ncbi:MAG: hypothetical protein K0S07_1225 [Chlamydiales bacterium]|jgi:ankyrin repeat protein|nr:hypothetical protein [Chlamydiales bacterium]